MVQQRGSGRNILLRIIRTGPGARSACRPLHSRWCRSTGTSVWKQCASSRPHRAERALGPSLPTTWDKADEAGAPAQVCTRPVSTADSKSGERRAGSGGRHLWIVLLSCSTRETWTPAIYMHTVSRVSALFLSVVLALNSSRCHRFPAFPEIFPPQFTPRN